MVKRIKVSCLSWCFVIYSTHLKSVTITINSVTVSIVVSLAVYKCYCSMSCITIPAIITIVFSYTVFKIIAFT